MLTNLETETIVLAFLSLNLVAFWMVGLLLTDSHRAEPWPAAFGALIIAGMIAAFQTLAYSALTNLIGLPGLVFIAICFVSLQALHFYRLKLT